MSNLTLDPLHLVVLLGALQGLFLAAALVLRRSNRAANRLLAAAMLAFSIALASNVYHAIGLESRFPHFFGVAFPMAFLFGPLIYLYAAFAADRSRRFTRMDALHFLPFLLVAVAALPVYLSSAAEKLAFYERIRAGGQTWLTSTADPLKYVSGLGYGLATLLLLRKHRERVKESYSTLERVTLRWLLWLGAAAVAIWVMATVFSVLDSSGIRVSRADDFISIAVAVVVYAIGYVGLRQPEVFRYETAEHPIPAELRAASAAATAPTPVTPVESARYERSGLSDAEARRLKERLLARMDHERPWADSELTLADLAAQLSTTPHKLSEVLNAEVGETFYDFVNGYRVRDVQRRIAAGEARGRKMLALALDAGFASKSTFNQVFKKHTNQTPSDYRQSTGG
jgi:AraC-like DNA-binding protein